MCWRSSQVRSTPFSAETSRERGQVAYRVPTDNRDHSVGQQIQWLSPDVTCLLKPNRRNLKQGTYNMQIPYILGLGSSTRLRTSPRRQLTRMKDVLYRYGMSCECVHSGWGRDGTNNDNARGQETRKLQCQLDPPTILQGDSNRGLSTRRR